MKLQSVWIVLLSNPFVVRHSSDRTADRSLSTHFGHSTMTFSQFSSKITGISSVPQQSYSTNAFFEEHLLRDSSCFTAEFDAESLIAPVLFVWVAMVTDASRSVLQECWSLRSLIFWFVCYCYSSSIHGNMFSFFR